MKGCELDTDGDGNCPKHPQGCPKCSTCNGPMSIRDSGYSVCRNCVAGLLHQLDLANEPNLIDYLAARRGWMPLGVGRTMNIVFSDGKKYAVERVK